MKRIPDSLVNIAKRFRSSADNECCPEHAMSATFGPSVEDGKAFLSLSAVHVNLSGYGVVEVKQSDEEAKVKAMKYDDGWPKILFEGLQSENPGTVARATQELDDLLNILPPLREQLHKDFLDLGGHATIVLTMRKWPGNAKILSGLCLCVGRMVMLHDGENGDGTDANLVSSFVKMGGVHTLCQALVAFADTASVQSNGMLALAKLCGNCEAESSGRVVKLFVGELQGVSLVSKAMKAFPDEELVQENGCWLLNNLCRSGGHEEASVIKSKALMVVAASIQRFPDNVNIEKDAGNLMKAVLSGVGKNPRLSTEA
jgi:hypothetical protein